MPSQNLFFFSSSCLTPIHCIKTSHTLDCIIPCPTPSSFSFSLICDEPSMVSCYHCLFFSIRSHVSFLSLFFFFFTSFSFLFSCLARSRAPSHTRLACGLVGSLLVNNSLFFHPLSRSIGHEHAAWFMIDRPTESHLVFDIPHSIPVFSLLCLPHWRALIDVYICACSHPELFRYFLLESAHLEILLSR